MARCTIDIIYVEARGNPPIDELAKECIAMAKERSAKVRVTFNGVDAEFCADLDHNEQVARYVSRLVKLAKRREVEETLRAH